MSTILSKRPSSRSSSRPRSSHKTRDPDPSSNTSQSTDMTSTKMRDPDPLTKTILSHGTIGTISPNDRRISVTSIGRNDSSPVRVAPVGPNATSDKPPLLPTTQSTQSRATNVPSVTNRDTKLTSTINPASLSQPKGVSTNPSRTAPKAVSTTTVGPASLSKPVPASLDTKPKASPPSTKSTQDASNNKHQPLSRTGVQKTSSTLSTKTKPSLLSRSPSKPPLKSSSPSPPIDKDIPNLPADRPVRGVDPVFAVAEMINEEIPIKTLDEILSMSTRKEICANTGGAIGNTPLVLLNSVGKGLPGKIAVKLEYMNPAGSVKDRVGYAMIDDAEKRGLIEPGKTVLIEPTSGNMGIALAFVARIKGYKLILTMPASMSVERRSLLKAYGAEVVLTDPATAVKGALQRAKELQAAIPNSHILNQFGNPANVQAHYNTTGPEVWEQTNGKVDIVCYGVGSGGTLSGVGKYLKEKKPSVEVYPVEPFESSVINGLPHSPHKIQGMGTGFIPEILDKSLFSEALRVHSDDAIAMAKRLATEEAILGGISSGANVCAAVQLATRPENEGKLIVTNINSFGERYLSTTLYSDIREAAEKLKMMSLDESLDIAQKYVATD